MPDNATISTDNPYASKPKKVKKEKTPPRPRIIVCGAVDWTSRRSIIKVLKSLDIKRIEFIATGISRTGAEPLTVSVSKELGIALYQIHPWTWYKGSESLACGKAVSIFKPTHIICFDAGNIENKIITTYQRIANRKDIELIKVKK